MNIEANPTIVESKFMNSTAHALVSENFHVNPRDEFLHNLGGHGKSRYKRYVGLPLRYAGGKSLEVGYVLENMPQNVIEMASPFVGGGSVEVACAKELGINVVAYDVFDILVNYWQVQLNQPKKLAQILREQTATKKSYDKIKQRLKQHWTGDKKITNRLDLAMHYWFNHNLSYGPGFLGWMSSIYQDTDRYARLIDKVERFHCPELIVHEGSFEQTIPRHNGTFLYCDPPYYLDGDSKMFRGIYSQRNFPVHHNGFDHLGLRDLLRNHKGGFVLSYNDCATIRNWYAGCKIKKVKWQYTLGQGETRIGKNRIENCSNHHIKESHEILIIG